MCSINWISFIGCCHASLGRVSNIEKTTKNRKIKVNETATTTIIRRNLCLLSREYAYNCTCIWWSRYLLAVIIIGIIAVFG